MSRRNEFEGNLVRLRAVEPDDGDLWYAFGVDTELDRLSGFTHLPSSRAVYCDRAVDASKVPDGDSASLMIETLEGVAVGSLSAPANRRTRVFDYGIGIGREHWRMGYGTEALELLFRFYFLSSATRRRRAACWRSTNPRYDLMRHSGSLSRVDGDGRYHTRRLPRYVLFGMTVEEFTAGHT